jgi:hypothetical protein
LRAQKKEQEKGTRLSWPFGHSYASRILWDVKKLASLEQFLRLIPQTASMLSGTGWDFK